MAASTTKIRGVTVSGLFNRFEYSIPFEGKDDESNGLVIITAPNGYGKSTILRLVHEISNGDYYSIGRTPFRELEIATSDGICLKVQRISKESKRIDQISGATELEFTLIDREASKEIHGPWKSEIRNPTDENEEAETPSFRSSLRIERDFPYLRRISPSAWRDMRDGRVLTNSQVGRILEFGEIGGSGLKEPEPNWLVGFRQSLRVIYISANRLRANLDPRGYGRPRSEERVHVVALRVSEQIKGAIRKYAESGRSLEQKFPERIIKALDERTDASREEVMLLIDDIRRRESRFQDLALVSTGQTVEIKRNVIGDSALVVLKLYLEDIRSKFQALEETAKRLEIFVETINSLLMFKRLKASVETGFQVIADDDTEIPLSAMSSGEQHLIVLLGELVLGSTPGSVILLDEPEISFHPEWQERFPNVLDEIIQINDCSIVMATHSPTLIRDRWEAVIELANQVQR